MEAVGAFICCIHLVNNVLCIIEVKRRSNYGRLQLIILGYPGQRRYLDLCGPFPSSDGFVYIFSAIDPFSKYAVACPIRNKEAATIAKVFVESVLEDRGLAEEILSVQGLELSAEIFKALLDILGVGKLRTTAFKPSTNAALSVGIEASIHC
jgi:hypothetical protein